MTWKTRLENIALLRRIAQWINFWRMSGGVFERDCPCCSYHGFFESHGRIPRADARCPKCGSLERHRLLALALDRLQLVDKNDRIVHFAAEPALTKLLSQLSGDYMTADLRPERGLLALDIEKIDIPAASVEMVIASHVLEHVDDKAALGAIHRVLKPGGVLLLMVPIIEGWAVTYEDDAMTCPKKRRLYFGQDNHVRYYGRDLRDRIGAAGFSLEEFTAQEPDVAQYGLIRGETLFVARKQQQGSEG